MGNDKLLKGGCTCQDIQNITVELELSKLAESYAPRECDCDFCKIHNAAYISDPKAKVVIRVKDAKAFLRAKQGDELAEFLMCSKCESLIGVMYEENNKKYSAINANILNDRALFSNKVTVSPKKLSAQEKVSRWKELWIKETILLQ